MTECSICLCSISNDQLYKKWNCRHVFHKECAIKWNKSCPLCLETEEIEPVKKKDFILDVNKMKRIYRIVESNKYISSWKKLPCITENHGLTFHKAYGVLGICSTCGEVQCFNCREN